MADLSLLIVGMVVPLAARRPVKARGAQVSAESAVAVRVEFSVVMLRTAPPIGKAATLYYLLFSAVTTSNLDGYRGVQFLPTQC